MPRSAPALPTACLAVLITASALAGPAPRRRPAPPPASRRRHASAEPAEAQLPPVDPAWRRRGWHAVVPHGYVLRALAPIRRRPEASAPAAFWLKGGVRVPILEQRARWWRVGWTHGRSGWIPAADLQPHASFILIDVRTGRVLRRLAAKGEQGAVSDGQFLWSLSDTGITRMSLTHPPAIWSDGVRRDPHGSLPEESVWTRNRARFYLAADRGNTTSLIEAFTHTGAVGRTDSIGGHPRLVSAGPRERVVLEGESGIGLYDPRRGQQGRQVPGWLEAVASNGTIYAYARHPSGRRELIRYTPHLKPSARRVLGANLATACLSRDNRTIALLYEGRSNIELRRADTLARVAMLPLVSTEEPDFQALVRSAAGWWSVFTGEGGASTSITRYSTTGRPRRTWHSDAPGVAVSRSGRWICMARASDLLVIDTADGATRRVPYRWRRPLPAQYLPKPSDPVSG